MILSLRLGWRNLWRNPRRSLISISAVASALLFLAILLGMTQGIGEQMLDNGTSLLSGHVQLHHPDYLPDRNLFDTLGGRTGIEPGLLDALQARPEVRQATPRVYGFALLSTGEHSAGAQLISVQPDREAEVSRLLQCVQIGRRPGETSPGGIWLGKGLAREIQATLGSEIAAVTQAADGSLGNELFRVEGILRTGLSPLDNSVALLEIPDLQLLLALPPQRVHEIVIRLQDVFAAGAFAGQLNAGSRLPEGVRAQSWEEFSPQLRDYLQIMDSAYGILIGFVALFAALGILNTMLMAVFERTREIGTVGALGMPPASIIASILIESLFLALLGVGLGLALTGLVMPPLETHGLDLSRWTGEISVVDTYIDPVLRFRLVPRHLIWSAVGLVLATLVAALLPALRASRLDPAKALTTPQQV